MKRPIPENNYFKWLCDIVGGMCARSKLLSILYDIDYYWIVSFDEDRETDGLYLRKVYKDFVGAEREPDIGKCKVLEVLVSLAISCEDNIMHDRDIGDRTGVWFWLMLTNLGLMEMRFTDSYLTNEEEEEVRSVIDFMLSRKYGNDGQGSLFPCASFVPNFVNLDLWLQMNTYLNENFEL